MEIRIGIINNSRELSFESDRTAAEIEKAVSDAISGGAKLVRFEDTKGDVFLISTESLAYLELGSGTSRRIGFVA